jgi:hypothetical protein
MQSTSSHPSALIYILVLSPHLHSYDKFTLFFQVFRFKLYVHFFISSNTAHAGSAVLIKSSIDHYQLNGYKKNYLQATSVRVNTLPNDISVSAVYCPPRHNVKKEQFNDFFQNLGPKFIAGGDFNSKHTIWEARLTTTKCLELAKVLQENNYTFLSIVSPTYWHSD